MQSAPEWCLDGDVIVVGDLRVTAQRIAASHWRPDGRLRSWGQAPLHREHDAVLVPCGADECLWLGAWVEDGPMDGRAGDPRNGPADVPTPARIAVRDPASGASAVAALPDAYQLGALLREGAPPAPLQLAAHGASRRLAIELECGAMRAAFDLVLQPPTAWAAHAHRAPPAPLDVPPPLPPRLG